MAMLSRAAGHATGTLPESACPESASPTVRRLCRSLLLPILLIGLPAQVAAQTAGVTLSSSTQTVAEDGGTDRYTVVLNTQPLGNVAVMVTSSDTATFTVAPLMLTFATSNWNQPQTVTVTGVNDDTHNTGDERTGAITHTISTADGGAYTTGLELDSVAVTVTDDDDPTLTVSLPNGETTIEEGGGFITVRMTADPEPGMSDSSYFLRQSPGDVLFFSPGYGWSSLRGPDRFFDPDIDFAFNIRDNDDDQPNGTLTIDISVMRGFAAGSPSMVTLTIIDNDPTEVSLIRTGTGAIDEGGTVAFTVQLSRALIAGEIIDVPLAIDGTGVTPADWGLTEQAGIANTGVSLHDTDTAVPFIRFSGAGAETALLQLAAALDDTDEGGSETFMIALGQDGSTTNGFDLPGRATNVGGGADPDGDNNRFELVVNDEGSTVLSIGIDSVTDAEGDAGETTFKTVTVSLSRPYSRDLVVNVRRSGSATRGTDYELVGTGDNNALINFNPVRRFTITAGATSVQFRIRVIGDTVFDIDETVVLTLIGLTTGISEAVTDVVISNIVGAVTHTIENDDPGGKVTVSRSALSMEEADGAASYTLVLDSQPGDEIILTVAGGEADTATVNTTGGMAGIEQTLTFTTMNWDQAQTVLVAAVNDNEDNAGGSRRLTLTHTITTGDDAGYSTGLPVDAVVVTVVDDEATEVSLSYTGGSSVAEGDIVEFTVMLARALVAGETLDVPLQIGGTGGTPADWLLASRSGSAGVSLLAGPVIRFAGAGARTATLELTTVLDGAVEGSGMETWSIALGDFGDSALAGGASPRSGSNTFSVQVQDFAGTTVRIEADTTSVTEGTPARFTLTADPAPAGTLAVNLVVTDVAGSDFLASGDEGTQTVTIGTGGTFSYSLPTTADTLDEIDGPVTVAIADGTGYRAVGGRGSAAVTVNDDDDISLSITIDSASDNEGDNGETIKIVTVSLSRPYDRDLFPVLRLSGSATLGTDYDTIFDPEILPPLNRAASVNFFQLSNQDFYIPSGETSFELRFRVMGDTAIEADETVMLTIIQPSSNRTRTPGLSISDTAGSITHTIVNDDATVPTTVGITVNPASVTVAEDSGTDSYTVVLNTQPVGNNVAVMATSSDAATFTVAPLMLTFATSNWNQPQAVTVTGVNDDTHNTGDERTGTITHTISTADGGAYTTVLELDSVAVTVMDDDDPTLTVSLPNGGTTIEEGGSSILARFTADPLVEQFLGNPDNFRTLTTGYASFTTLEDDSLVRPVDYEYFIDENNMDQPNGTLTIHVSDPRFAAGSPSMFTLTIIDNDPTEVSLIRTGTGAIDEGGTVAFTVQLSRALIAGEIIEVPLSVTGTDVEPADWSLSATGTGVVLSNENTMTPLLRFENADAQTAELTLTANGDDTLEGGGSETYVIALGPDGDVPNGFDQDSLNTNVGGGADPHSGSNTFSVQVDDPTLTVSLPNGETTIEEGGSSITARFTVDPPVADVLGTPDDFITLTTGYSLTSSLTSGLLTRPVDVEYFIDEFDENNMDQPNGTLTIHVSDPRFAAGSPSMVTLTIIDNDPTEVSLIRTGSTGAIDEGQAVTFTVELGRALVAGEIIEVPLSVTGTDVEPADWSLSATGTGVVLSNENTMTPLLRFEDAGAQTAELTLTANGDNMVEGGGSETYVIALGQDGDGPNGFDHSSLSTNVGGGADPHSGSNTFSVQVNDVIVMPMITITGGATVTEGMGSASFTLTATPAPTDALTLMLNVTGGSGFITTSGAQTVALNSGSSTVTYLIATQGDAVDEPNGTVTVTVGNGTGYEVGDPSVASVGVHDDDATPVTLAGDPGNVAEGDSKPLTLTLGRALEAGEQLTVPLTFGGTATFGTDYTLTGTTANGVDYSDLSGGSVIFSAGGEVATLTLMAQTDAMAETGGETVRIGLGTLDSNSGTNLGGGASGTDNLADFTIEDATVPTTVGITVNPASVTVAEDSGTDSYTVVLNTLPVDNVAVMVTSSDAAIFTVAPLMLTFATSNWNQPQAVTVTGVNDDTDNTGDERTGTITHTISTADGGAYTTVLELDSVAVTVMDDDATPVTLAGDPGNVAEGDSKPLTITLGRALEAGEQLTVRLIFGGTATFGTDYTLTGTTANGVDYGELSGGSVTFSAGGQIATLTLMAQTDAMAETGGETVRIGLGTLDSNSGTNLGGGASGMGNVDFTIEDATVPTTVGITVNPASVTVAEDSGTDSYTVVLNTLPVGNVAVMVTSSDAATFAVAPLMLTFATSNWNQPQAVTVTGVNDDTDNTGDERTGTITHTISTADGGAYTTVLELDSVAVTVMDDDDPTLTEDPAIVLTPATAISLIEGSTTSYTVALATEPMAEVVITLSGATTALGADTDADMVGDQNTLTFSSDNWNEEQVVTLSASADDDSDNDAVTLAHTAAGAEYDTASAESLMVRIMDNTPALVLSTTEVLTLQPGGSSSYMVALAIVPTADVIVTVMGHEDTGLTVAPESLTFSIGNWNMAQTITVTAGTDSNALSNRVILTHMAGANYGGVTAEVEVRVGSAEAMQAAQQMWLPRFGLTAIEHMLGGLHHRFTASDQPGLSGNLNGLPRGQSFNAARLLSSRGVPDASVLGIEQLGAGSSDRPRKLSRTLSLPKLLPSVLRGSHFTFRDEDGTSIWGRASYSSYKDADDGTSIDGEVTTAMLGVDHSSGRTLLGLALAYSDSDGEWQSASASDEGDLSGTLASLLPYLRYDLTERLQLWGAASYGRGDLEQTSQTGRSEHDLEQVSATAGLRGTLLDRPVEEGGLSLRLISDMTLARIKSDDSNAGVPGVPGMTLDTQRFRMGLEWSWQLPEEGGMRLTPELELGLRYDGGDTSEGFGLELGGGLNWQLPARGLTFDVRSRYLLEHEASGREEWGLSGSLRYKARPDSAHGPSFSLRHEYGNAPAASGLDRLLSDSLTDALKEDNADTADVSSRWTLKGEWGFALMDDATGIPYASLSASDAKRDLTLGWRLLSNPAGLKSKLDIKAIRREQDDNNPRHSVGAEWKLNW